MTVAPIHPNDNNKLEYPTNSHNIQNHQRIETNGNALPNTNERGDIETGDNTTTPLLENKTKKSSNCKSIFIIIFVVLIILSIIGHCLPKDKYHKIDIPKYLGPKSSLYRLLDSHLKKHKSDDVEFSNMLTKLESARNENKIDIAKNIIDEMNVSQAYSKNYDIFCHVIFLGHNEITQYFFEQKQNQIKLGSTIALDKSLIITNYSCAHIYYDQKILISVASFASKQKLFNTILYDPAIVFYLIHNLNDILNSVASNEFNFNRSLQGKLTYFQYVVDTKNHVHLEYIITNYYENLDFNSEYKKQNVLAMAAENEDWKSFEILVKGLVNNSYTTKSNYKNIFLSYLSNKKKEIVNIMAKYVKV